MKIRIINFFTKSIFPNALIPITLVLLTGCSDDDEQRRSEDRIPSVEPIEAAMKTMVPLGYAASMFMTTINETNPPNTECASEVCVTTLEIPFDQQTKDSFPVTLESEGEAKLYVAGIWTTGLADEPIDGAVISLLFIDMQGGSFGFPTYKISTIPVTKTELGISTVYSSSDLGVEKDTAIETVKEEVANISKGEMDADIEYLKNLILVLANGVDLTASKDYWLVNVNDVNGTPDNFSDDSYGLSGGGVYSDLGINSGSAYQVSLANVLMGNNCKINPTEGKALISDFGIALNGIDSLKVGYVKLAFDATCDGQAYVESSWGTYGATEGKRAPLDFSE